jgi:hypothetical protein
MPPFVRMSSPARALAPGVCVHLFPGRVLRPNHGRHI